jgi:hypothetical protein
VVAVRRAVETRRNGRTASRPGSDIRWAVAGGGGEEKVGKGGWAVGRRQWLVSGRTVTNDIGQGGG